MNQLLLLTTSLEHCAATLAITSILCVFDSLLISLSKRLAYIFAFLRAIYFLSLAFMIFYKCAHKVWSMNTASSTFQEFYLICQANVPHLHGY